MEWPTPAGSSCEISTRKTYRNKDLAKDALALEIHQKALRDFFSHRSEHPQGPSKKPKTSQSRQAPGTSDFPHSTPPSTTSSGEQPKSVTIKSEEKPFIEGKRAECRPGKPQSQLSQQYLAYTQLYAEELETKPEWRKEPVENLAKVVRVAVLLGVALEVKYEYTIGEQLGKTGERDHRCCL